MGGGAKYCGVNFNMVSVFTYLPCFQDTFSTLTILIVPKLNKALSYSLQGVKFSVFYESSGGDMGGFHSFKTNLSSLLDFSLIKCPLPGVTGSTSS